MAAPPNALNCVGLRSSVCFGTLLSISERRRAQRWQIAMVTTCSRPCMMVSCCSFSSSLSQNHPTMATIDASSMDHLIHHSMHHLMQLSIHRHAIPSHQLRLPCLRDHLIPRCSGGSACVFCLFWRGPQLGSECDSAPLLIVQIVFNATIVVTWFCLSKSRNR